MMPPYFEVKFMTTTYGMSLAKASRLLSTNQEVCPKDT